MPKTLKLRADQTPADVLDAIETAIMASWCKRHGVTEQVMRTRIDTDPAVMESWARKIERSICYAIKAGAHPSMFGRSAA